jgi:hypothetical protein
MERLQRLNDLIAKKAEVDRELGELKAQMKAEAAVLKAARKPRAKKEPAKPAPAPAPAVQQKPAQTGATK